VRSGYFGCAGEGAAQYPWRLLSYGHCGVGGAMAHLVETHLQMTAAPATVRYATPRSRCCMATAACCPRMSACSWSGCDERKTRRLDSRRGSDRLPALRRLWRRQYFRRSFCAACGAPDPQEKRAIGEGTVYATSLVCRAATPETKAHVPYNILLVDTREAFA